MIDYSKWPSKFPWVISVHDKMGRCLYAKPGAKTGAERQKAYKDRLKTRPGLQNCLKNGQSKSPISL